MISVSFKVFLENKEQPYELYLPNNEKYSFHYGFGHESWGYTRLKFRVKFWTMDSETVQVMRNFMENLYPNLQDLANIKMLTFEFHNSIDNSIEIFTFNKNEFANLNMTQVVDALHKPTFVIAFNILDQE